MGRPPIGKVAMTGAERVRRYRLRNPVHDANATSAHNAVASAVKTRRLIKEPCLFCEATENVQGHHRTYAEPLSVVWLCGKCHRRLHVAFPELSAKQPEVALRQPEPVVTKPLPPDRPIRPSSNGYDVEKPSPNDEYAPDERPESFRRW